ncbi:biotin transporter BioY [Dethiosulfovibrio sp. F2B]|uniref:biotin transporter BioY n=1 Tax=Dethiosulfovibrio faecalis TaxID=2720018 RepID=UPI001F1C479C|nr:biotin transporter BioY [Dethiosulfovibrio faecalis]MCF4151396.1 biotin transporter BioY [Dethiosulfovibrio faecalis]
MKIKTRDMVLVALFAGLTAVGAFLRIPIGPAPISMQNFFTVMSGCLLGARLGAASQGLYVSLGLIGVPVFTSGGGPSYLLNPTFGFLLGFIFCAWIIGRLMDGKKPSVFGFFLASLVGSTVVYAIGVPWLYVILTKVSGMDITFMEAVKMGCLVFIPGDLVKIALVSWLSSRIVPLIAKG